MTSPHSKFVEKSRLLSEKVRWLELLTTATFICWLGGAPLKAQTSDPEPASEQNAPAGKSLQDLYRDGVAAFTSGDNVGAAAQFELLLGQAPADAKLEIVYLTLVDAYMRSQQFPSAVATAKKFLERYPKSETRNDALLTLGYAALKCADYTSATDAFQQLLPNPQYREKALLGLSNCQFELQQYDTAIITLQQLVGSGITSPTSADGALLLEKAYFKTKSYDKAVKVLRLVRENPQYLSNILRLNTEAFKAGEFLVEQKLPAIALEFYHLVLSKKKVIDLQEASIKALNNEVAANLRAMRATPSRVPELLSRNTMLSQAVQEANRMLDVYRATPDFTTAYLLRLARAYSDTQQHWEALSVYGEFLRKYPEDPQRESALYGIVLESAEANRIEQTRRYAEIYLHDYPQNAHADAVGYLLGTTSLLADDPKSAETYFGRMLVEQPDSKFREQMRFLLGNARFALGKYNLAEMDYRRYLADYPAGEHQEGAGYRIGLCKMLQGQYPEARTIFSNYLKNHPEGFFSGDAHYRLAICKFSAGEFQDVVKDCDSWVKNYGTVAFLSEVLALKADALVELGKPDDAIENYLHAYQVATTDSAMGYSLFAVEKLLQKKRQWERIEEIFTQFVSSHPNHPAVLVGILTVAQAKVRQRKSEEARLFIADAALSTMKDARRDSVEDLLSQLALMCVKVRPPAGEAAGPPPDPLGEMNRMLAPAISDKSPIVQARLLFAQAQLLQDRKDVAGRDAIMKTLAARFSPDILSPGLLAYVGDFQLERGNEKGAKKCYDRLVKAFPKSIYREYAAVGLGQVALRDGRYDEALRRFHSAIEDDGANLKLQQATLGKADALFALGRADEAKDIYEAVISTRAWRGESTASSIYALGQIDQQDGNLAKAISYFQKVYIGYRRYPALVAKAYAATGQCYETLGNRPAARAVYEEFVSNDKLVSFTEYASARKRLDEMNNDEPSQNH